MRRARTKITRGEPSRRRKDYTTRAFLCRQGDPAGYGFASGLDGAKPCAVKVTVLRDGIPAGSWRRPVPGPDARAGAKAKRLTMPGTRSHRMHRKESIHRYVRNHRKIWRFYWRIDRIFIRIEIGRLNHGKEIENQKN